MRARSVSVSIAVSPQAVYRFASNPENLPRWAAGLGRSVRRSGDGWVVESPDGPVGIRFAEENALGVLDHVVTLASGREISSPMRVIPNGAGSEVVFTLFQLPDMSEAQHAQDARLVERDLRTLKQVLEEGRAPVTREEA